MSNTRQTAEAKFVENFFSTTSIHLSLYSKVLKRAAHCAVGSNEDRILFQVFRVTYGFMLNQIIRHLETGS
jgi:hypothetical protein